MEEHIEMKFEKIVPPSLTELFVADIEGKILSGELKIGEKLPSERELAEQMKISRAVVNSGIWEMEQKGFLLVRPRIGTFVQDYRKNGTFRTLESIMKFNGGTLGKNEVKSIYELRIVLVKLAAELLIENGTEEDNVVLKENCDKMRVDMPDSELADLTFTIYHEIAFRGGNSLLPLLFMSFRTLVCVLWVNYIKIHGAERLIDNTRELVSAIEDKNMDRVKKLVEINTREVMPEDEALE